MRSMQYDKTIVKSVQATNDQVNAARFLFCSNCQASLSSADDEAGRCTQCDRKLPALRRLLLKIAAAYPDDPGTSDLDDEQPAHDPQLDLGDVRLAWRLLR